MEVNRKIKALFYSLCYSIKEYRELSYQKKFHRCKLLNIQKNSSATKMEMLVRIEGVKNHIPIKFSPEELVVNDMLLAEFSQTDVRMITYYALQNTTMNQNVKINPIFRIVSQEIRENMTIFIIKKNDTEGEFRMTAIDLLASDTLRQFSFEDLRTIVYAATAEQTLSEME